MFPLLQSCTQTTSDLLQADIIITEDYEMATAGFVRMKQFTDAHGLPLSNSGVPAVNKGEVYSIAGVVGQTITAPDSDNRGSVGTDWFERATSRCEEVSGEACDAAAISSTGGR